jgi:hypothetical protein
MRNVIAIVNTVKTRRGALKKRSAITPTAKPINPERTRPRMKAIRKGTSVY